MIKPGYRLKAAGYRLQDTELRYLSEVCGLRPVAFYFR
jgi:hypothetical protein